MCEVTYIYSNLLGLGYFPFYLFHILVYSIGFFQGPGECFKPIAAQGSIYNGNT